MTRVIRNRDGFYFKNGGGWVMHFDEAERFPDIASVITTKVRYGLECVSLVLVLHDQPCREVDVVLPLEENPKA